MNPELEQLKKALHPEVRLNIVEQCRIVAQALAEGGDYAKKPRPLAEYLGISPNKVYKMNMIHKDIIIQLKEWLKGTIYETDTSYKLSTLSPEDQLRFVNLPEDDKKNFLLKFQQMFLNVTKEEEKENPVEPIQEAEKVV